MGRWVGERKDYRFLPEEKIEQKNLAINSINLTNENEDKFVKIFRYSNYPSRAEGGDFMFPFLFQIFLMLETILGELTS